MLEVPFKIKQVQAKNLDFFKKKLNLILGNA